MDRPMVYAGLLHARRPTTRPAAPAPGPGAGAAHRHQQAPDLLRPRMGQGRRRRRRPKLLADTDLAHYRHYLEQKRAWKPHYLSEPEEKVLDEKAVTGRAAFVRLFDETVAR